MTAATMAARLIAPRRSLRWNGISRAAISFDAGPLRRPAIPVVAGRHLLCGLSCHGRSRHPGTAETGASDTQWALQQVTEARPKGKADVKKTEAAVAMYDTKLAGMLQLQPAFLNLPAKFSELSKARSQALMHPNEMARHRFGARNSEFATFAKSRQVRRRLSQTDAKALPSSGTEARGLPRPIFFCVDRRSACPGHSGGSWPSITQTPRGGRAAQCPGRHEIRQATSRRFATSSPIGPMSAGDLPPDARPQSAKAAAFEADIAKAEARLAEPRRLSRRSGPRPGDGRLDQGARPWSLMQPADIADLVHA